MQENKFNPSIFSFLGPLIEVDFDYWFLIGPSIIEKRDEAILLKLKVLKQMEKHQKMVRKGFFLKFNFT